MHIFFDFFCQIRRFEIAVYNTNILFVLNNNVNHVILLVIQEKQEIKNAIEHIQHHINICKENDKNT